MRKNTFVEKNKRVGTVDTKIKHPHTHAMDTYII